MGYAGAQFQLLMYKNQKADVELKMMLRQDDIMKAADDTKYIQKYYSEKLTQFTSDNDCSVTDEEYLEYKADIDAQMEYDMADITVWEEELNLEQDSDNAEVMLLNTNITNLTSLIQKNVQQSHTYGGGGQ